MIIQKQNNNLILNSLMPLLASCTNSTIAPPQYHAPPNVPLITEE